MRRVILPYEPHENSLVEIRGDQYHHLARVLRVRPGQSVQGITKQGTLLELEVYIIEKDFLTLKVIREIVSESKKTFNTKLILYQSIPKFKKMDSIVRQGVEIGVFRIIPVISRYTVSIPKEKREIENKIARWQKIANEAVKQSRNMYSPKILLPIKFSDLIDLIKDSQKEEERFLLFHPLGFHPTNRAKQEPISEPSWTNPVSLHETLRQPMETVNIIIGPEGGFSDEEVSQAVHAGAKVISIGDTVFRTETAAIFALSAIKAILYEREIWYVE